MTVSIIPIDFSTDTFLDLITKANNAIDAVRFKAVTVDSPAAVGHATIQGSLSVNTTYTSQIYGGVKDATTPLSVSSNASFINVAFNGTNTYFSAIGNIQIPGSNTTNRSVFANNSTGKLYYGNLRTEIVAIDGTGSGIDSDLLDGQEGVWYTDIPARQGYVSVNKAGDTITGDLNVGGITSLANTLNVQNTVVSANSTTTKFANTPAIELNQMRVSANTASVTTTTPTIIHQFPKVDWNTGKYTFSIINSTDSTIMASELLVVSDAISNVAHSTQYAVVSSNNIFGEFSVNNLGANTRIIFTSFVTKTLTVNYTATLIK